MRTPSQRQLLSFLANVGLTVLVIRDRPTYIDVRM